MGMGCGITMIKYVLFVFNLVCALCGIAILAAGVMAYLKLDSLHGTEEFQKLYAVAVLCIALGSVIFLIAFFGCCGAINESSCMTSMYSTILLLLLIAQIVFGVMLFMNQDEVKKTFNQVIQKMWQDREHQTAFWDKVQSTLKCCGLNSSIDYLSITTPKSCCEADVSVCNPVQAYTRGCKSAIEELTYHTNTLAYFILAVAGIELVGVIFGCCLVNSIRNQERRYA